MGEVSMSIVWLAAIWANAVQLQLFGCSAGSQVGQSRREYQCVLHGVVNTVSHHWLLLRCNRAADSDSE